MYKKLTFTVLLLMMFSLNILAQSEMHYGIFFGGSVNTMNISRSLYYDDSEPNTVTVINPSTQDTSYKISYLPVDNASAKPNGNLFFGGFFDYKASDNVGLQFELLYQQYGYKLKGTVNQKNIADNDYMTYNYESSLKMSNLSAAIMINIYVLQDISVDLGVQPSYCFRMTKETKKGPFHKNHVYDDKDEYNPLNIGATGGLTARWGDIFFSARYTLGLVNVLKQKTPYNDTLHNSEGVVKYYYDDVKSTTNSLQFIVGYRIR